MAEETSQRAILVTPAFRISQDTVRVHVKVTLPQACGPATTYRAVVDGGCVFGLACEHFHLPLVFPGGDGALVNGRGSFTTGQPDASSSEDAISIAQDNAQELVVTLRKFTPGAELPALSQLKPSIFGATSSGDAEADEEERLMGLEILSNGLKAAREKDADNISASEHTTSAGDKASGRRAERVRRPGSSLRPPRLRKSARSRIHEANDDDDLSGEQRLQAAWAAEDSKWDEGMYLDNFVDEDGEIKHIVGMPLKELLRSDALREGEASNMVVEEDDKARDAESNRRMRFCLVDVLLAQAYDTRTTLGDPSVESVWTICKLARSLSAACTPDETTTLKSIVIGAVRRQLSYPLYRSWEVSQQVIADVVAILRVSRAPDAKAASTTSARLASLTSLLQKASGDDDAVPIYLECVIYPLSESQILHDDSLLALAQELEGIAGTLEKSDVGTGWDLAALEAAALEALAEGEGGYV